MKIQTKSKTLAEHCLKFFNWLGICTRYGNGTGFGIPKDIYVVELRFPDISDFFH